MSSHSIYSIQSSRHEQLTYFSHTIDKGQGRTLAFQSLDKRDRIAFLALCKISASTINWDKIGKQKLKGSVRQLLKMPTEQLPPLKLAVKKPSSNLLRLPPLKLAVKKPSSNLLRLPPQDMTKTHLMPFLTIEDLANLQSTHKAAPELGGATSIIKNYGLAPLIARYCHQDCEILSEGGKIQALHQLMSMVQELSELEQLELPSYQSVGQFFELIEARNLLRMADGMHQEHPLAGLENDQLQIAEDSASTLQRAETVRAWLREHQASLQAFDGLNLLYSDLTLLPSEIGQLRALTELQLDNNRLTSLPKEIGQLGALTELRVSGNRLTSLPKEIGLLGALTELRVSGNRLTSLPKEIGLLGALRGLSLDQNRLTSLPKEIGQLGALTSLYLGGNRLTSLPKEIGLLGALRGLNLNQNCLTSLPKEIGQLGALTELWLDDNRLTSLLKEIDQLAALRELDIAGNRLTSLPKEIRRFREQLKYQRTMPQLNTILNRMKKCLGTHHDCKGIAELLDEMEEIHGKKIRSTLHGCVYEVCKNVKPLRKKVKSPHFGRTALIDPKINRKLKIAALNRFKAKIEALPEYQIVPIVKQESSRSSASLGEIGHNEESMERSCWSRMQNNLDVAKTVLGKITGWLRFGR